MQLLTSELRLALAGSVADHPGSTDSQTDSSAGSAASAAVSDSVSADPNSEPPSAQALRTGSIFHQWSG